MGDRPAPLTDAVSRHSYYIYKNMNKIFVTILCGTALLSSCRTMSNYERPESVSTDSLYRDTTDTYAVLQGDTTNFGNTPWREVFTEPQLQALIEKALTQNADLRKADLTITQAEAALKVARLAYLPSMAFSPQGTISSFDGGKATKTYSLPIQASWQIGSLGSLRNTKKQGEVNLELSRASKQAVRTNIISAVANLYYTLQMLDEQLATTEATLEIWGKNVTAMEKMWEVGGLTNSAAVEQAKANYYQIQATVPALKQSITSAENALCLILHEAPHPISRGTFSGDGFPEQLKVGVPVQLLSNRPDVKAAELSLANAFYATNVARSAFYPSLTIRGQAGWTNSAGAAITNPAKFLASAVGSLVQPLFANGQLTAQLKIAKAKQEAALIDFEQSLYQAGAEVSDALSQYQARCTQEQSLVKQVEQLTKAVDDTNYLFAHGNTTSYLETLTAQSSLLQAQLNLISTKFDKVQAAITLYQALGGGRD